MSQITADTSHAHFKISQAANDRIEFFLDAVLPNLKAFQVFQHEIIYFVDHRASDGVTVRLLTLFTLHPTQPLRFGLITSRPEGLLVVWGAATPRFPSLQVVNSRFSL
jgi:hypothetical protein